MSLCNHCKGEHWNSATRFPTPGIALKVKLDNGDVVASVRPRYVSAYTVDPNYINERGELLKVVAWQYA